MVEVLALRQSAGSWRVLLPNQDLAWSIMLMQRLNEPDDDRAAGPEADDV